MLRRSINNRIPNGGFDIEPPFVAATTGNNRVVDGTAAGGPSSVSPSDAKQRYAWKVNHFNTTSPSARYENGAMRVTGVACKERVNLTLGNRIHGDLDDAADIRYNLIPVLPNTSYTLKVRIKTQVANGVGTPGNYGADLLAVEHSGTGYNTQRYLRGANNTRIATTTDWTTYTLTFTTQATTRYLNLVFGIYGDTSNYAAMTAWFDDLTLDTNIPTTRSVRTNPITASNRALVRDMGTALSFDGASSVITASTSLAIADGFCILLRFKPTSRGVTQWIGSRNTSAAGDCLRFRVNAAGTISAFWDNTVASAQTQTTTAVVKYNEWNFFGLCLVAGQWYLYLNGTLKIASYTGTPRLATGLQIGKAYIGGVSFVGLIDEVVTYASFTPSQAAFDAIFYKNAYPAAPSLTWLFNEASGAAALDTSGNGNPGTITGATYTSEVPLRLRTLV